MALLSLRELLLRDGCGLIVSSNIAALGRECKRVLGSKRGGDDGEWLGWKVESFAKFTLIGGEAYLSSSARMWCGKGKG